jgi:hypothetical protein
MHIHKLSFVVRSEVVAADYRDHCIMYKDQRATLMDILSQNSKKKNAQSQLQSP